MSIGKRLKNAREGVDREKLYALPEAIKLVKANATAKFDESVEIAANLGVDPRHADQNVRGVVALPSGTGRDVRVAVIAKDAKAEEARAATDLAPGHLRHPVIYREGECIAVSTTIAEYEMIRARPGGSDE